MLLGLPAWVWALLGLMMGLAGATGIVLLERHNLQAEADLQFSQLARRSQQQIERQLETSGLLLRAVQSAFLADDNIGPERFLAIQGNLRPQQQLPSLVATVFARRAVDAAGRPHYAYEWVAPVAGNERLIGFDMASQRENLLALELARDTDQPVMSGPFPLMQPSADARDAAGVVVRLPVYAAGPVPATVAERRRRELGALGSSMRLRPLLLSALPQESLDRFHVRVYDVTGGDKRLFFDSETKGIANARSYGGDVVFGQRHWRIQLDPRDLGYDTSLLWGLALGGLLASVLLASLLWSVAATRRRAVTIGRQMSARYGESEQRFRTLNDLLPALVVMAHADDGQIIYANQAALARLGQGIAGVALPALFEDQALQKRLSHVDADAPWNGIEAVLQSITGDRFWAATSISRVHLGQRDKLLMVATDISEQRQLTELLTYQASHDTLTELYNRREFERHLRRALHAVDKGGPPCALLYIDLDQFKLINDTSGHLAGDQLLSQLALAMADQLRVGDVLARLGGDEFGILAIDVSREGAQSLAERLRVRIEGYTYVWEQRSYMISASIGVVLMDHPGQTMREVLSQADTACYMAKDHGRNRVHLFSEEDDEITRRRGEMEWHHRLRWVLEENRLLLDYQEVVPLQQAPAEPHIELLIRLRDEQGQVVMPGAFLPAAERYGMVSLLDRWVIAQAIAHFDQLHASGRPPGRCSVNLSAASLEDDSFVDYVLELIERHGIEASRLCFEITETEAVRNLARAVSFIERLRAGGCLVALDDFGAGMSSFGYIKNLPVDVIKIDGSFIRDLDGDPMNRSIVEVITEIGHQRGLDVVAEWVGDQKVIATLRALGVDYGQGFALHRPEPVLYQRLARRVDASANA
jgi:diguanylate cyclase (GGDEF)-like protein/PAS domain S-box-containing protein